MTKDEGKSAIAALNELFAASQDRLREIVRAVMQEMLEAEMTDALGAEKGERPAPDSTTAQATTPARSSRGLASLILRPVLNRLFERYQRSEQALVAMLAEMYVQGVSTR